MSTALERKRAANRRYMRAARLRDPEKFKQRARKWRAENAEEQRAKDRARYWKNPEPVRARNNAAAKKNRSAALARARKARGVPEPTRPMPNNCECCGAEKALRPLNIDHCHRSGIFRGWLCSRCNSGIGQLGDNSTGLLHAVDYLLRFETREEEDFA